MIGQGYLASAGAMDRIVGAMGDGRSGTRAERARFAANMGFGPKGPWLVTPDELPDRDDLRLSCSAGGRVLQDGRTRDMIFSVPELVARISAVCPMLPGDLIFTGTPSGWGWGGSRRSSCGPGRRW